jgi:hypothetical protein
MLGAARSPGLKRSPSMTADTKTYSWDEAFQIEAAICRRLRHLAGTYAMQLDWEVTFLGSPKRGEDWTFTFSSSGKNQTVTLTERQLEEFRHGDPEGVDQEILPALRRLKDEQILWPRGK